jgi:hypothetical protein
MEQFLTDIFSHPLSTISIVFLAWVWTKDFCGEVMDQVDEVLLYQCPYSFYDFLRKQAYSIFMHGTFLQLIFEIFTIWHLRHVEMLLGTTFLLRYSLLYLFIDTILRFAMTLSNQFKFRDLYMLPKQGFSGLLMFWSMLNLSAPTTVLGIFTIGPFILPLVILSFYALFVQQKSFFSMLLGIFFGLLIHFRIFIILEDIYWSFSFIIDVFLVVLGINVFSEKPLIPLTNRSESNYADIENR